MSSEFSFVIVTDTHVDARPERSDGSWWHRSLYSVSAEILRAAVREINKQSPDFVIHCGDLTNASDEGSFLEAARILRELRMPLHFVPGNHDTYESGARALARRLLLPDGGPFHRVERFAGWRLILLDTVYWRCKDGTVREEFLPDQYVDIAVPPAEMDWLRGQFARDGATHTLCFTHAVMAVRESYPVGRMPDGEKPNSFPVKLDDYVTCAELTDLLKGEPCVKAAFYGHGGWHECLVQDGMLFCQTAELVQYPVEMRLVRVFPDRLETEVFGLPDKSYAQRAYMKEWGNDWSAGRETDRYASYVFR